MKFQHLHITIFLLLIASGLSAQKPKKTYDHNKFAKKVVLFMNSNDVSRFFADAAGIQYISEKTGKAESDISKEVDANKTKVAEDLKFLNDNGIYRILDKTTLENVRENPIKQADIVLHCHYQDKSYRLVLTNCIQTNTTWVLGDGIRPEGDDIAKLQEAYQQKSEKKPGGLLGKIQDMEEKQEAREAESKKMMRENPPTRGYHAKIFPMQNSDAATKYIKYDAFGLPLDGYYITNDGKIVQAAIVYQEPEKLMMHEFDLAIANHVSTSKVDYLNPNSDNNFKTFVKKETIKAFFVGEQLFVRSSPNKWHILISEGAIRELVAIAKIENNNGASYVTSTLIQKLLNAPVNKGSMAIGFKNTMSTMVDEHTELAEKIRNKATGYTFEYQSTIIREYNAWYAQKYPAKIPYVMPYLYNLPTQELDDFGYYFFKAIQKQHYDYILGLMATRELFEETVRQKEGASNVLAELNDSTNAELYKGNMERFNNLLDNVSKLNMEAAKYDKFIFTSESHRYSALLDNYGHGYLYFSIDSVQYKVLVDKMFELDAGWKGSEFGTVAKSDSEENSEQATPEIENPLPDQFKPITGTWVFSKIFENGQDKTAGYAKGLVAGEPMRVFFDSDGTVIYQKGYRDRNNISYAQWEYIPESDRKADEMDIDFTITTYNKEGNWGREKLTLVSITETELVYENKALGLRWVWTKSA